MTGVQTCALPISDVPLLVYTARNLGEDDRHRLQLGATEFLDKTDVPPDVLDRRVTELLECVARRDEPGG